MYKALTTGAAAVLIVATAGPVSARQMAYAPVASHTDCAAIETEARIVQRQVIDLGSLLLGTVAVEIPFANARSSLPEARLGFQIARGRMDWLREAGRIAECGDMPAWHYLEELVPPENPVA